MSDYIDKLEAAGERARTDDLEWPFGKKQAALVTNETLMAFSVLAHAMPEIVAVLRAAEYLNEPHERTDDEHVKGTVDLWLASDALRQAVEGKEAQDG